jgi:hypothetical protein
MTCSPKPAKISPPHVIDPNGLYFPDDVRRLFRWKASSLRREVRLGRLRVAKLCGRYYILGRWLLERLESGEIHRRLPENERQTAASNGRLLLPHA